MNALTLSNESIDNLSEFFTTTLLKNGIEKQTVIKARLATEEILLNYQQKLSEDSAVFYRFEKRFSFYNFTLSVEGESCDPFADLTDEDLLMHNVMQSMGCAPSWSYKNGKNEITFSFKQKQKLPGWASILIVAVLGAILGFAAHLLPDGFRSTLTDTVLSPLSSVIMGFLSTVSVLMIFLSIISGIGEMGDITTFNRIGKKMMGRFAVSLVAAVLILLVLIPFLFGVSTGSSASFDFTALWQMLLNIIPGNIIDAFYTGNTLQVIFLAACIGVVALSMIRKMQTLNEWTKQLSSLVQALIELIIKLLPIVVFVSIFNLFAADGFDSVAQFYKFPLYHLLICLGWSIIMLVRTAVTQKVSIFTLLKKLMPTYIIALSTSSSSAAFHTNMETCERELGIDKQIVNVGVPLSQSLFKPSFLIESCLGTLCMAKMYNVEITASMIATLLIMAFILSFATPPLPGAAISSFAMIFAQCGVPAEAISLIIAFNAITDRISTPTNILSEQLELIQLSGALHNLDKDTLRKKKV